MAHIVGMLERQGFDELIANLHYYPDTIRDYFGDRLEYRFEEELLGTAGGVRNVADFFGDDPVVIVSGDALTDTDLNGLVERHRSAGGIATLTVKKVATRASTGWSSTTPRGASRASRRSPTPPRRCPTWATAASTASARDLRLLPGAVRGLGAGRVPGAARGRRALPRPRDRGLLERRRLARGAAPGTFDALDGELRHRGRRRRRRARAGSRRSTSPVWVGRGCEFGEGVRLMGPVVIGTQPWSATAPRLRGTIVFPGTEWRRGRS